MQVFPTAPSPTVTHLMNLAVLIFALGFLFLHTSLDLETLPSPVHLHQWRACVGLFLSTVWLARTF